MRCKTSIKFVLPTPRAVRRKGRLSTRPVLHRDITDGSSPTRRREAANRRKDEFMAILCPLAYAIAGSGPETRSRPQDQVRCLS